MCREEGVALNALFTREDKPLAGFGLFGFIKETGVDNQGIIDFQSKYFPHPIYKDQSLALYKALGNRSMLSGLWNPLSFVNMLMSSKSRVENKGIVGNLIGEGLVQGGVIVFGQDGKPKYAYQEQTGNEMPVEDILAAVNAVKKESTS